MKPRRRIIRNHRRLRPGIKIIGMSNVRGQYGWPCFHCGTTLLRCNDMGKCCARCKGKASH